ncbi:metallophosphoesterase [Parachitinimonas caeni]|uniref:Metallophosphoesterase n=1 Tax=Parachitinimonas caeni TaxID=3031301 RepID=A0ABT7E1N6_9NEIS|nr:metallophosphoesterase [Parachitinimonas caeni]MDK2126228.1 metallophosphoesterase [Parachitinimonas caeni]
MGENLLILHLSDIHFRKNEFKTTQDPNYHLRNELILDAREQCLKLGSPHAVIISGDIAFAGEEEEFNFATEWLTKLCNACGCNTDSIFVVPGNHDVVRSVADANVVKMVHDQIKKSNNPRKEIDRQLADPDARTYLYKSLVNYNNFASKYQCALSPPDNTRAIRTLTLNDGSLLRLWGVNTTFVSSSADKQGDLFVDTATLQIPREDGVINLVVGHHDLSWIRQQRELADHLSHVAPIQMFGHVHTNRITMERDFIRLIASAAIPEREEAGWEPGYNLIHISVEGQSTNRKLNIHTHVRVWQTAPSGFRAKMDKEDPIFKHSIALPDWNPPQLPMAHSDGPIQLAQEPEVTLDEKLDDPLALRNLIYRFSRLSFSTKTIIAKQLGLLENDELRLPTKEQFRHVASRARERGLLDKLKDAVAAAELNK